MLLVSVHLITPFWQEISHVSVNCTYPMHGMKSSNCCSSFVCSCKLIRKQNYDAAIRPIGWMVTT